MPQFSPINAPTKVKSEPKDQASVDLGPVGGPVQQVKEEAEEGTTEVTFNGDVEKVSATFIRISKQMPEVLLLWLANDLETQTDDS